MFEFTIRGQPVPCARARVTKHGTFTPKKTRDYKAAVRVIAQAMRPSPWESEGRFFVEIEFHCADRRKRDLDNLAKGIVDACTGVLWADDSAIDRMLLLRFHQCVEPKAVIRVGHL